MRGLVSALAPKKEPQISPLRCAPVEMTNLFDNDGLLFQAMVETAGLCIALRPVENISRKGPQNCGSGYAPNDTGRADDRYSAAPTALGSSSGSISQPSRAGLTFGGRPSGPCIHGDLALSFLPQLAAGKSAARDDKGKDDGSIESDSPT